MKIILTGAQGTGKTTILNEFKKKGWNVVTEVVRKLSKEGVKINELGDVEGQTKIFNTYVDLLSADEDLVSDRGLTDVMAYTAYLTNKHPSEETDNLFISQYKQWMSFSAEHPDVVYCYFPIEFPVVDDGVRSLDENYRKEIDEYIEMFFKKSGMPFIEVRGTVEERIKIIEGVLDKLNQD